jgi:hypothetical protein
VAIKKDRGMDTMLAPGAAFAVSLVPESKERNVMKVRQGRQGWVVVHARVVVGAGLVVKAE